MSKSLLENLRSRQAVADADFVKDFKTCPPISRELLAHLDQMFGTKEVLPTSPSISAELIFQAGIDKLKNYLRVQNSQQETKLLGD